MSTKRFATILTLLLCVMVHATSYAAGAPTSQFGFQGWPYRQSTNCGGGQTAGQNGDGSSSCQGARVLQAPGAAPAATPQPASAPAATQAPAASEENRSSTCTTGNCAVNDQRCETGNCPNVTGAGVSGNCPTGNCPNAKAAPKATTKPAAQSTGSSSCPSGPCPSATGNSGACTQGNRCPNASATCTKGACSDGSCATGSSACPYQKPATQSTGSSSCPLLNRKTNGWYNGSSACGNITGLCPTGSKAPATDPAATPAPAATAKPSGGDYTPGSVSAQEAIGFALLNQDRASNGRAALTLDPELCNLARMKSEDMKANRYFAHTSPTYGSASEMLRTYGYSFTSVGENIAHHATVEKSEAAFMSSTGHRTNILGSQWKKVGIGVAYDAQGFVYVTQLFVR